VPGPLVAVVAGIAASAAFGFADHGVKLLGLIPAGLPYPRIPQLAPTDWQPLAAGAVGLALISYNSAMVTAKGFAAKNRYDIDPNQDFIALGVANLGAGVLSGFAVSGADSRTAMNDSMGGKTQVTGLVAAAVMALTLVFLTRPLGWLPVVVLSAVLIKAAMGLFDWKGLLELRRISPPEFRVCVITLLGVITVGVLPGVVVAVAVAMVILIARASQPHDAVLGRIPGTEIYRDCSRHPEALAFAGLVLYRFDAALLFFNAEYFKERARAAVRDAPPGARHFVLDADTIPLLDTTGAAILEQVRDELALAGVSVAVAGARSRVHAILERTGFVARIGPDRMFPTLESAIAALSPPPA